MRSTLVLSVLAALLAVTVAYAAKPQTAIAELTQLGASGISGSADFKEQANGDVRLHEQLSGLTPGVTYDSAVYLSSTGCGSGTRVEIMQFTANAAGKANINVVLSPQATPAIAGGAFISVEQSGSSLSCGEIVAQ
jgi:hypothetical protein